MSSVNERPHPPRRPVQVIAQQSGLLEDKQSRLTKKYEETTNFKGKGALVGSLIGSWPNFDVWPFKFGVPSLCLLSAGTAGFLNRTFREALALDYRLRLSSYLGLMAVSGLSSAVWHYVMITTPILENRGRVCPVCLQVKAAGLQLLNGVGYPLVLAPVVSYVIASSFKNRHLPKIYKRPGDVLGYTRTVYKPVMGKLGYISVAHIIFSMGLTYFEQECFFDTILPVVEGREALVKKPKGMGETPQVSELS